MRGLTRYAWRSLVARPARSLLTILGIGLGVGLLVASLGVNAGLDASVARTVTSMTGRSDLRVSAFAETGLSAASLDQLAAVPGVALTAPAIERRSYLSSDPGRPTSSLPVTILGVDPVREARIRDLALSSGAPLSAIDAAEALVTEQVARAHGLVLGTKLAILGAGAPVRVTVVGIFAGTGPEVGSSGQTVVIPIRTAQLLSVRDGQQVPAGLTGITRIDVAVTAGATVDGVVAAIGQTLNVEPYVVTLPRDTAATLRGSTSDIRSTMGLLAVITLFAAAILILNTMAMTVVERVRELGLLRAAGASRGQVVRIIVFQGLALGIAGSVLGTVLGLVLAYVTAIWLRAAGSPTLEGPAITPLVLAGGPIAGLAITLVAAFEPARRAAGISPVAVLRSRSDPTILVRSHTRWLILVVVVLSGVSMLLLPGGSTSLSVPIRALLINAILLFTVLAIPPLLGPLSRICGLPFRLFAGFEERLARAAIRRDPGRTALTAGALVAGISMVVALSSIASTTRFAATAWLADVVPGDEVLTTVSPFPFDGSRIESQLLAIDGVERVTPLAAFDVARNGIRLDAVAIHGADFLADGRLTFTAGDRDAALRALDTGGAVVLPETRAARLGVGVGDSLQIASSSGLLNLKVVGLVARSFPGRTGDALIVGWTDAAARLGISGADSIVVRYDPAKLAQAQPQVDELAAQLALTGVPASRIAGAVGDSLDKLFGLMDLLAIAAVAIAGLGIVNTLSMDTRQRLRELGMLRAAGMSRVQVWRSVLIEAGILGAVGGLMGCATGLVMGVLLGGAASGGLSVNIVIPWPTVAASFASCIALSMVAAFQPARMAGQVSIVAAVRGE